MILIPNRMIACEPLKTRSLEKTGTNFVTAKQKNELLELTVVYPPAQDVGVTPYLAYQPGDRVYVRGDCITLHWTAEKFELGGREVILVPLDRLQAWKFVGTGENREQVFGPAKPEAKP